MPEPKQLTLLNVEECKKPLYYSIVEQLKALEGEVIDSKSLLQLDCIEDDLNKFLENENMLNLEKRGISNKYINIIIADIHVIKTAIRGIRYKCNLQMHQNSNREEMDLQLGKYLYEKWRGNDGADNTTTES